jgi:hypothetical protein
VDDVRRKAWESNKKYVEKGGFGSDDEDEDFQEMEGDDFDGESAYDQMKEKIKKFNAGEEDGSDEDFDDDDSDDDDYDEFDDINNSDLYESTVSKVDELIHLRDALDKLEKEQPTLL